MVRALIPQTILKVVTASITNKWQLLLIINIFLLIVGMFMETTSAITILMPIMIPLISAFDINLVQFGIIVVLNLMIGVLTPPFGLVLFVTSRIGNVSVHKLSKALIPWILALLCGLFLITVFPGIVLWLPEALGLRV